MFKYLVSPVCKNFFSFFSYLLVQVDYSFIEQNHFFCWKIPLNDKHCDASEYRANKFEIKYVDLVIGLNMMHQLSKNIVEN